MQLAVIGNPTFTLGFRLAGVTRAVDAETDEAYNKAVRSALGDAEVGIIVMETADLKRLEGNLRRDLESRVRPTLVTIGLGEDTNLREKLKQAVGVDLWK